MRNSSDSDSGSDHNFNLDLMFSPSTNPLNPLKKDSAPNIAQITDKWLIMNIQTPVDLLICPICFEYTHQPIECSNCNRLFCKTDFKQNKQMNDKCPLCKASPWVQKESIHISYKAIMNNLKFDCGLCSQTNLVFPALEEHLKKAHNQILKQHKYRLHDYTLYFDDGRVVELEQYQNLQINYNSKTGLYVNRIQQILDEKENILYIDLNNMSFMTETTFTGKIKKQLSKSLDSEKEYVAWLFKDSHKYRFFRSNYQDYVQSSYQKYLKNLNLTQIHLDTQVKGDVFRYRIMFDEMVQLNTKTKFKRTMKREILNFSK